MLEYLFAYSLETHLFAFILGGTRLTVFAMIAPFMGNNVLGLTARRWWGRFTSCCMCRCWRAWRL